MAKVRINGEYFDWDPSRKPMSEALAIENGLKCIYAKWEEDMRAGSARALAAFMWLVWRRNGRDVSLEDILAGKVEIDLNDFDIENDEDDAVDPTGPPPEASSTTGSGTSASSRNSSASGRGSGRSSASPNAKR